MPNTNASPFMGIPVPVVGVDPGPDWANNINAGLGIIDAHDHSTGKGAPITGSIVGSPITDATIDSSVIGATTPAAATFTTLTVGTGGPTFQMLRVMGTNAPNGTTVVLAGGDYNTIFGVVGVSSYAGGSFNRFALGGGGAASSAFNVNALQIASAGGNIEILNLDNSNANSFDVTIFYFNV